MQPNFLGGDDFLHEGGNGKQPVRPGFRRVPSEADSSMKVLTMNHLAITSVRQRRQAERP